MADASDDTRDEQQLLELLNELRVILPGTQVLFAFLLTVPFSARFTQLDRVDRAVYFAALLLAAGSSAMLIAPSIHARLTARDADRSWVLATSNPLALAGGAMLAAGVGCTIYLVSDVLYRSGVAAVATAGVTVGVLSVWYGIPFVRRRRG